MAGMDWTMIEPEICLMCHAISCDSRWTLPLVFGRFQGEWFCAFSGAFLQEPGKKVPTWSQDYVTNRRIRMMTVARLHISEVWLFPRFFVMRLICYRLWHIMTTVASTCVTDFRCAKDGLFWWIRVLGSGHQLVMKSKCKQNWLTLRPRKT